MGKLRSHYSRSGLWLLFLIAAFPLHVWTIVLWLRDFSWISERTNAWDAVGVGAYGLLIAFVESVFVFVIAFLLGYLISGRWNERARTAVLSALILITATWAILNQLYFLLEWSAPAFVIRFFAGLGRPLVMLYAATAGVVSLTVLPPVFGLLRSQKAVNGLHNVLDRLALLTMLYLFLDLAALVIVILRNVL